MTDRTQSPDDQVYAGVFAPIDASLDDPWAVGFGLRGAFLSEPSEFDNVPGTEREGHAYMEPMNWRLSDPQRNTLLAGAEDRRFEVQLVSDVSPEFGGDALFGQPEFYSPRNRSTRWVDPEGRVALSGSGKRIVDSYDQRYALAEQIHAVELGGSNPDFFYFFGDVGVALSFVNRSFVTGPRAEIERAGVERGRGVRDRDVADMFSGPAPEVFSLPDFRDPPTGYVFSYGAPEPRESLDPTVTRERRRTRTRAELDAELGREFGAMWSTVFAPEAARGFYRRGLEETPTGPLPIRTDALFAMGPVDRERGAALIGSIAFTSGNADSIGITRAGLTGSYGLFRGARPRWFGVGLPATAVPSKFAICLQLSCNEKRGVRFHRDDSEGGHSAVGTPSGPFAPLETGDWMIRVELDTSKRSNPLLWRPE